MRESTLQPIAAKASPVQISVRSGEAALADDSGHVIPGMGNRTLVRKAGVAIAGTALVALCAHVSLPLGFTPVPFTLQPFAILLLGLLLDPVMAFATLALYLAEGAVGLPVFSPHGLGGVAQLLGPTGGYLMAAPAAAATASALSRIHRGFLTKLMGAAAGDAILLVCGAAWLGTLEHASVKAAAAQAIAPFLTTDFIKVAAAAGCAGMLISFRSPRSPQQPNRG